MFRSYVRDVSTPHPKGIPELYDGSAVASATCVSAGGTAGLASPALSSKYQGFTASSLRVSGFGGTFIPSGFRTLLKMSHPQTRNPLEGSRK